MIQEMENNLIPKGSIDLVGFGRLGLRTGINLIQIHRGGPSKITVFDGQKISPQDIIFLLLPQMSFIIVHISSKEEYLSFASIEFFEIYVAFAIPLSFIFSIIVL